MSQVIKTFMGLFFLFFLTFLGIGIMGASMQVNAAKEFKENAVMQIENSGFNESVMNQCISQASDQKYYMTITIYKTDGSYESHDQSDIRLMEGTRVQMAEVMLAYQYGIPFLGIRQDHTVMGYAR